jgi:hypothetical protein
MKGLSLASAIALILLLHAPGGAQVNSHQGTVTTYHLNSEVPLRGPCLQTEPPAPTLWICLYRTNPLYNEMREVLRTADQLRRECRFGWSTVDDNGFALLSLLECS